MSDYSPPPSPNAFDELEDVLYDADPAPDLADELASHALHSPLLYAAEFEPGYELQEYYSDWEYYSDDYYDDDPSILKSNPIDGSPSKRARQSSGQAGSARGRKRKIADRDSDVPPLDDDRRYLRDCMKGTVWAQPVARRDNVYRAGENERVALLKDWRAKFGTASPKKGQGKAKTQAPPSEDEAWANDLSLADMGLMNARGSMAQAQEGDDVEDEEIVEGAEGEEEDMDSNGQEMTDEDEDGNDAQRLSGPSSPPSSNLPRKSSPLAVRSRQTSPELDSNGTDDQPTKRRKKNAPVPPPVLPSPPATNGSTARRTRSRADSASTSASATTSRTGKQQMSAVAAPTTKPASRKRKASPTDEDAEEDEPAGSRATGPTTSSRAKRAASTANNVVSNKGKTAQASAPARATRNRKK